MNSRSRVLVLVVLVGCVLLAIPLLLGGVLFVFSTGGMSLYLGIGFLVTLIVVAVLMVARGFFRKQ